jgi:hypothetical protein
MAIQCSKCNLYRPNHEVRNCVCENCYEDNESTSSEDEETESSSSEDEVTSQNQVETVSKTCTKCKISKQLELFHKNNRKKDDRRSICKECRRTPVKDSEYKTIDQSH